MSCPYCHGPLCQVRSLLEDKQTPRGDAVLWRCIVCGADTRQPKANHRWYSERQLLALASNHK